LSLNWGVRSIRPLHILCHADIHGWNLIIDKEEALYIVDWDTLIFAPKERDLMFVGAGIWDSGRTAAEEESLFYRGYGQTKINQDAICYYRFERIIQDIAEYCEYIFLSDEGGEDRVQSLEYLQSIFLMNGAIERAYQADKTSKIL
jgi:spectinomycin phosphotransferase